MDNYYTLFEVPHDADISMIRSAFRKKAKSCHPDLFQHVSLEERKLLQKNFVCLSQAYETLADPKKRQLFDMRLKKSGFHARQQHDQKNKRSSSYSSSRDSFKFKQNSAFSRSSNKSASAEPDDTLEDLLKDVEEILGQFGLNFKDPLEMLVDWARQIFEEISDTFNEEVEHKKDSAGSKNKSQKYKQNHDDPLHNVEEELQRLKAKSVKSASKNNASTNAGFTDAEIEQELRSIKKKYKL